MLICTGNQDSPCLLLVIFFSHFLYPEVQEKTLCFENIALESFFVVLVSSLLNCSGCQTFIDQNGGEISDRTMNI